MPVQHTEKQHTVKQYTEKQHTEKRKKNSNLSIELFTFQKLTVNTADTDCITAGGVNFTYNFFVSLSD